LGRGEGSSRMSLPAPTLETRGPGGRLLLWQPVPQALYYDLYRDAGEGDGWELYVHGIGETAEVVREPGFYFVTAQPRGEGVSEPSNVVRVE
jgi:hypothetical protein